MNCGVEYIGVNLINSLDLINNHYIADSEIVWSVEQNVDCIFLKF